MPKIKIPMDAYYDRKKAVLALASAGYDVHVEQESFLLENHYFIVFTLPEGSIIGGEDA